MDNYFEIGKITGTHGIKGAFRVFPTTESPERFELLKQVTIENNGLRETFTIEKIAYHKKFVLMTVKEIKDINIAEGYKNASVLIPPEQALPLGSGEYYARDLYGMRVVAEDGEELGLLDDIYFTGANDVYSVKKEGCKELLIPAIKDCVLNVDVEGRVMTVRLLEGLR